MTIDTRDLVDLDRRRFLEFMGKSAAFAAATAALGPLAMSRLAQGAGKSGLPNYWAGDELPFTPVQPSVSDELRLAEGFRHDILIKWDDIINSKGKKFGFNNDFTCFVPDKSKKDEGWLWVCLLYTSPSPRD